jgi:hypothetical protein
MGAPSQPVLSRLTKKEPRPAFITRTEKGGWGIDIDSPAWLGYLRESAGARLEQKPLEDGGLSIRESAFLETNEKARQAVLDKVVFDAEIKKSKARQEEIKTQALVKNYVDAAEMRYFISFFQRAVTDSFAEAKKIATEMKQLFEAGQDKAAEMLLKEKIQTAFENAMRQLGEEIEDEFNANEESDTEKHALFD